MVIEKINKEGHNAAFNPVTIHCAKHGMENRRFELGPPGESKLPLSNRKYTDFLKILIIRISISFWIFTGGVWDLFVLLPKIWVVGVFFCARFPPREAS